MVLHWWSTLQARLRRPRRVSRRKTQHANLLLEALEDRAVPSVAGFSQNFESNNTGFNYTGPNFVAANDAVQETNTQAGVGGIQSQPGSTGVGVALNNGNLDNGQGGSAVTPFGTDPTFTNNYDPTFPLNGFSTSLDIYLDPVGQGNGPGNLGTATDTRFDWSSAINRLSGNTSGSNDFVFNAGYYTAADTGIMDGAVTGAGSNRFVISASTNAGRNGSYPGNLAMNPISITTSGWYTFKTTFQPNPDNSGTLQVVMTITQKSSGMQVGMWTLNKTNFPAMANDIVSGGSPTVGGNAYGWFASQEFQFGNVLQGPGHPSTTGQPHGLVFDNVTEGTNLPTISSVTYGDNMDEPGGPGTGAPLNTPAFPQDTNSDPFFQHSMIREITIVFNGQVDPSLLSATQVTNDTILGGAINIDRVSGSNGDASVNYSFGVDEAFNPTGNTTVTLTFVVNDVRLVDSNDPFMGVIYGARGTTGDAVGSLANGNYTFTADSFVNGSPQNVNGAISFWRLFGDYNGDRWVDSIDQTAFNLVLNKQPSVPAPAYFDYDSNGRINNTDSNAFNTDRGSGAGGFLNPNGMFST